MKVAIIGGGASGLVCAIALAGKAKEASQKVDITIYEAKDRVGKKILATGNGRCNMMNENENVPYFGDSSFASYALKKFDVKSNLSFFSSLGLYTRSDSEGRIYPLSNQASSVLDVLRFECERLSVKTVCSKEITKIKKDKNGFDLGDGIKADRVVIACGGKAGVKGFTGYELLRGLDHKIVKPSPSLTKLNVKDTRYTKQLKGIRHKVKLTLTFDGRRITEETGEILFADYGLSGIAVMQLSAFVTRNEGSKTTVYADMIPDFEREEIKTALIKIIGHDKRTKCENLLTGFMPKKIGEVILKECGVSPSGEIGTLSEREIEKISALSKKFPFEIDGVRGFEDAQVTAGGADTKQFNEKTMESKKHKGLYCCGEVLDVDGLCGGYNLHWAWSSGRLCGESIIGKN